MTKRHQQRQQREQRRRQILDIITLTGPVTSPAIAEALGMDTLTVGGVCLQLKKNGLLYSTEQHPTPERRHTLIMWSVTPPQPVVRYRNVPDTVGIDEEDIAWMQHYRQQAQQRQQRRAAV